MQKNGLGRELPELEAVKFVYQKKLQESLLVSPFEEEVADSCWMWLGEVSRGYGVFRIHSGGKRYRFQVHRLFWAFDRGRYPSKNSDVHHRCGNVLCCNPKHLVTTSINKNRSKKVEKDARDEDCED